MRDIAHLEIEPIKGVEPLHIELSLSTWLYINIGLFLFVYTFRLFLNCFFKLG